MTGFRFTSAFKLRPLLLLVWGMVLSGCYASYGQSRLPIGGWQVHAPYQQGRAVAEAEDRIYCATEGGLFYYDKEFNSIQTITKADGLREQRISAIKYDAETKTLIIAYENTNIDLLRGNKIININDVFRKTITGEKVIHQIQVHEKLAYLSTSFGMVVLDLAKLEVKDTYSNLGPGGEIVDVRSSAVLRDSIYLATGIGVLGAKLSGVNLQDFASWVNMQGGLEGGATASLVASFNGKLYAATLANGIFRLSDKRWVPVGFAAASPVVQLSASANYLLAVGSERIMVLDKADNSTGISHALLREPADALIDREGAVWAADRSAGLVKLGLANGSGERYAPNGPYSNRSFALYAGNGSVYSLSGGYDDSYLNSGILEGFSQYQDREWKHFSTFTYPDQAVFPRVGDLVSAVYNPVTDKMYFASYGSGLFEWKGPGDYKLYNGNNSSLLSALSLDNKISYIRTTDLAVDGEGSVWVVNRNQFANQPGLHVLRTDNSWQSFVLPGFTDGSNLEHILIDDYNQKWLSVARRPSSSRAGMAVYDTETQQVRYFTAGSGRGGLPNGLVYCLTKDLNGDIWVGTAGGVGVFYNPGAALSQQPYDAYIPVLEGRPLLDGQVIRAIAVDGGNRKWMGTDNGLWVFNPDGTELLYHFTSANSPLPSNKVHSVAVEHKTGEVFVATDAGIASYRLGATITEGVPECAVVFPNPVRRGFSGLIGISGLANNAQVRITDINGTLVYRGQATGGTITWDARGYNGKRVKAGVYLALSSDAEGKQACVSKIAILD